MPLKDLHPHKLDDKEKNEGRDEDRGADEGSMVDTSCKKQTKEN